MSATKSKATEQECLDNVYNRLTALEKARARPSHAPTEVLDGCASQQALADLDLPNFGISPMARNSMYKYADIMLAEKQVPDGKQAGKTGRHYLDWLRKKVMDEAIRQTGYRTKVARKKRAAARKVAEKDRLTQVEEQMLAIDKAYWDLFSKVRTELKQPHIDPDTRQRLATILNDHSETFHGVFDAVPGTPMPSDAIPDNVEPLQQ